MRDYEVLSVQFEPDAMVIGYVSSTDVRVKGAVAQQHMLRLSAEHPDYAEDIEVVQLRAVRALRNALEDFESSEPWTGEDNSKDDDESEGMGF